MVKPEGRIIQVHESTVYELQNAIRCARYDEAAEIVERLAAVEQRNALRTARDAAYKAMTEAAKHGDADAERRAKQLYREAAEALDGYAV